MKRSFRVSLFGVKAEGTYQLQVSNHCGLKNDEIIVKKGICDIYVPSAFTPNNDTRNDLFKASYGENISKFKMEIYNRYGELVFETDNIKNGWDGNKKGRLQPAGAYVWMIKYRTFLNSSEQVLGGSVILIR